MAQTGTGFDLYSTMSDHNSGEPDILKLVDGNFVIKKQQLIKQFDELNQEQERYWAEKISIYAKVEKLTNDICKNESRFEEMTKIFAEKNARNDKVTNRLVQLKTGIQKLNSSIDMEVYCKNIYNKIDNYQDLENDYGEEVLNGDLRELNMEKSFLKHEYGYALEEYENLKNSFYANNEHEELDNVIEAIAKIDIF